MSFDYKYAPNSWDELVFADKYVCEALTHYAEGRSFDHILLHGPHGSGKSQTAKVLVSASYGLTVADTNLDIVEHVDEIRDAIKAWKAGGRFGHTKTFQGTPRPYAIIQEVDRYDSKIQLKLRALMDTMVQARFVFTTNRIQDVDKGIADRCDCFELEVPAPDTFVNRAQAICKAEGVTTVSDVDMQKLLSAGEMSVRGYMRTLEKVVVGVRSLQPAA